MIAIIGLLPRVSPNIENAKLLVVGKLDDAEVAIAVEWGMEYLKGVFQALRDIICGKKKLPWGLKWPGGTFSILFAGLSVSLGVTNPITLMLVTFVAMLLAILGKEQFCKMTEEEFLRAFRQRMQAA